MILSEYEKMVEIEKETLPNSFLNGTGVLFFIVGTVSFFLAIYLAGKDEFRWVSTFLSSGLFLIGFGGLVSGFALVEKHLRILVKFKMLEKQISGLEK